jgi:hypothetical protein
MDSVDAGGLQPPANLDRVFDGIARLFLGQHRVVVFGCADLDLKMEIISHFPPDRAHDVEQETSAIFERAAIPIGPVIDGGAEKLGD